MNLSPGERFRLAMLLSKPLPLIGVPSALMARIAEDAGFNALYLSGGGFASFSFALPDLGMITPVEIADAVYKITSKTRLPLLVDIDTGFGGPLMIERAVELIEQAGAAGIHIEDQVFEKRCGHRDGKELCSLSLMQERIKACIKGRKNPHFIIMARTDSPGILQVDEVLKRAVSYGKAGADMLFLEGTLDSKVFKEVKESTNLPLLANLTEFGKCKLLDKNEIESLGADITLYPLTINRVIAKSVTEALKTLKKEGSNFSLLNQMQTRMELYDLIDYQEFEERSLWEK